jgi:hypothetical protein
VTEPKTREEKKQELWALIDELQARFADVPDDELQREIDKATKAAREETLREMKKTKSR